MFDVFQKGLVRGSAHLPFDPEKAYAYVEHPKEGWRVYLRSCVFLHPIDEPFQKQHFLVVKKSRARPTAASWEPPKGQMEGKDARDPKKSIMALLRENIRREVEEEAKITYIRELTHTGLVLQSIEPDFPPNTHFQYHIFSGYAHPAQLMSSFDVFKWIQEYPEEFKKLQSDQREKDAIRWYDDSVKMMGRWSPTLLHLYMNLFSP